MKIGFAKVMVMVMVSPVLSVRTFTYHGPPNQKSRDRARSTRFSPDPLLTRWRHDGKLPVLMRHLPSLFALASAVWLSACIPTASSSGGGAVPLPIANCALAEENLEFAPFMIADFEQGVSRNGGATYIGAQYMYSYTDGTGKALPQGYQPPAIGEDRCGNDPSNHVLRMTGGPFLGWGGGMGVGLMHLVQERVSTGPTGQLQNGLCPNSVADRRRPDRPSYCSPNTFPEEVTGAALNASEWDGVAFWARRGPNSQPLLRVLVGNKDTDDDIAYLMYAGDPTRRLYCERVRDCACPYQDRDCTLYHTLPPESPAVCNSFVPDQYYCGAPCTTPSSFDTGNNFCRESACDAPYAAYPDRGPDPQFAGQSCLPFTYRSGVTTNLCQGPTGKAPAETDQQCGDHFTFPLHLTTDWQLYLVPFAEMSQQGFAKKAQTFDLTTVSVVRLTWDAGYIDYYVDNLRFYRAKR
jgi:hypothetical protein